MLRKYFIKLASVLLIIVILGGCSSAKDSATNMAPMASEELKSESAVLYDTEEKRDDMSGSSDGIALNTSTNLNRKIIKTGNLDIETKDFDKTMRDIMNQAEVLGGFMQDCSIQGNRLQKPSNLRSANLTIRIPNKQFDPFMNDTDRYGNVVTKSIEGQDVTDQYMDTEIRLQSLEIQAERLKELLKKAGKLQDLFEIERELADVTYQIESLKGTLKKYDSLIDYATVHIYINETKEYQEALEIPVTFGEKIAAQFKDSLKAVGNLLKGCVLMIVALIPFLVIFIPIAIIGVLIVKQVKRKKQLKGTQNKETQSEE